MPSELKKIDVNKVMALKRSPKPVSVHYTGWIYDDSSPTRKVPPTAPRPPTAVRISSRHSKVIRGWDEGVVGMKSVAHTDHSARHGLRRTWRRPGSTQCADLDVELLEVK
jgi:hypothetical protein